MIQRTQNEIMFNWDVKNTDNPLVSIRSICFNQEKYIEKCLDGFLMQKTNFPFEVIIHDDASTDGTIDIIKCYQERYPLIIKPIFEEENQHSKGTPFAKLINPYLKGKYIARCEGDDCWTDENKLQMQVDFLESHANYTACAHNTLSIDAQGNQSLTAMFPEIDTDVSLEDALMNRAYHTSSIVSRREYDFEQPEFMHKTPGVGDLPLAIYLTLSGKVFRFGKVMSHYNSGTAGSWTERVYNNPSKLLKHIENSIVMNSAANDYSNHRFETVFQHKNLYLNFLKAKILKDYHETTKPEYKEFFNAMPLKRRIKFKLLSWFKN